MDALEAHPIQPKFTLSISITTTRINLELEVLQEEVD